MSTQEQLKQCFRSHSPNLSFTAVQFENEVMLFNGRSGDTLLLDSVTFSLLVFICAPALEMVFEPEFSVDLNDFALNDLSECLAQLEGLGFIGSAVA